MRRDKGGGGEIETGDLGDAPGREREGGVRGERERERGVAAPAAQWPAGPRPARPSPHGAGRAEASPAAGRRGRRRAEQGGGVSPPGAGTQLWAGRQVSSSSFGRPRGYTISSHKAEAPVRSGRGAGERKAGEGAERPRRRLWVPRPSQPPTSSSFTSSSPGSFFGRPRRGARRGRAPGRRSTGSRPAAPAAEAVCNRQLRQPREESRDSREEPGRRRGARRRSTQAPPSSPPSPVGEGAVRGGRGGRGAGLPAPRRRPGTPPACGEPRGAGAGLATAG